MPDAHECLQSTHRADGAHEQPVGDRHGEDALGDRPGDAVLIAGAARLAALGVLAQQDCDAAGFQTGGAGDGAGSVPGIDERLYMSPCRSGRDTLRVAVAIVRLEHGLLVPLVIT
ncbi:hypothetical protein ABW05_24255 [Mycolicibacterium senegalense]|uniref:Uncharacterized protein n=1 Tax=Mycolicibacterium senegalense TaxID=1796 RepID=A0ABR5G1M0_9MYCO|nr:hypothetical protein AA982_23085 [Mycolicibacterium senegalense]KLO54116.1 hypothetical protein ABW05_24255 [Mycolicibacterium senegalense]